MYVIYQLPKSNEMFFGINCTDGIITKHKVRLTFLRYYSSGTENGCLLGCFGEVCDLHHQVGLFQRTKYLYANFSPENMIFTSVSAALGTADPVFLYASKIFFNSAFSALNYKYNNKNIILVYGICNFVHICPYFVWKIIKMSDI